jgi:hypothetical protein
MSPEQDSTNGDTQKAPVLSEAGILVLKTLETALKNSAVVKIFALLAKHKGDADFLKQIDVYVKEILPNVQVAKSSDDVENQSVSPSAVVVDTREILKQAFDNEDLQKFLRILIVHQYNTGFLAKFLDYVEKKDPAKAKQRFMNAILAIGLNNQNSSMITMAASSFAMDITFEQAESIIPMELSDKLMTDFQSLVEQSFAESFTVRKPSDHDQRIVFSYEEGASGEFNQVVWLYKSDGTLMAMFISRADDGEWILSFRDCFVVKKEPVIQPSETAPSVESVINEEPLFDPESIGEDSGSTILAKHDKTIPDDGDDDYGAITIERGSSPIKSGLLVVDHFGGQEDIRSGSETLEDDGYGEITIETKTPKGTITSDGYAEITIEGVPPKKK